MLVYFVTVFLTGASVCRSAVDHDHDESNTGTFWQLTDIHYDTNYSSPLIAPNLCYLSDGFHNSSTGERGQFGEYACDSSWELAASAIDAMKRISATPDFVLWTGDSIPHISDTVIDQDKIFLVIKNITDKLLEVFPKVPVYPMVGNHDAWPAHQVPVAKQSLYYDSMLTKAGWDRLLSKEEQTIFHAGGYYSRLLTKQLRLVCLNSNVWYKADKLALNVTDPVEQFHWLELEMQDARNQSQKVILAGHVPPGTVGRVANSSWMYPLFNQRLLWLLQRYEDVIMTTIFGHEHTDSFRIVYNADGKATVPMFLAPAVTPWNSTLPGMGANNPAIRLYHYSRSTGKILDYTQFYLNLTEANLNRKANWAVEYRAKAAFNLSSLSAAALNKLVEQFKEKDSKLFQRYYEYNSVSLDRSTCTNECKLRHICSITKVDYSDYSKCLADNEFKEPIIAEDDDRRQNSQNDDSDDDDYHHRHHDHTRHEIKLFTYYLLGALLIVLVIVFFVIAFCCCRRRHAVVLLGQSRYTMIQEA